MKNPYEVLGIKEDAGEDEIKKAYREMVKKYHPDQYRDNPLSSLAEEKLREANEAYEQLIKKQGFFSKTGGAGSYGFNNSDSTGAKYSSAHGRNRETGEDSSSGYGYNRGYSNGYGNSYGSSYSNGYSNGYGDRSDSEVEFRRIRNLLDAGRIYDAQSMLESIQVRDAEWHFLVGVLYGKRGWYGEAYRYLNAACRLDPGNQEYSRALNEMNSVNQAFLNRGGYGGDVRNIGDNCAYCPLCMGMLCFRGVYCC